MEVTLRKKSWHYALNRWSLEKDPAAWSLCPYFWMTLWHIFTSPFRFVARYFVLRPIEWVFVPRGERSWETPDQREKHIFGEKSKFASKMQKVEKAIQRILATAFTILLSGGCLALIIAGVCVDPWGFFSDMLIMLALCAVGTMIVVFTLWTASKVGKSDSWSAIKGMVYAAKNKVCPAIKWKETNQNS